MKKLLSILSISSIIGLTSSNVVSCEGIDFSPSTVKKSFGTNTLNLDHITTKFKASDVYNLARMQIAKLAGITAWDIKSGSEAKSILLWLYDAKGNFIADGNSAITKAAGTYTFELQITKDSKHYYPVNKRKMKFSVNDLIKFAQKSFAVVARTTSDVYTSIRTQIAKLAGLTADDIKTGSEMNNVLISLWDDKGNVLDDNTDKINPGTYDVHITIKSGSMYYNPLDTTIIKINVDANKMQITQDTFKSGIKWTNALRDQDIYNDVRTQIAKLAGLTADDIKTGSEADNVLLSISYQGKDIKDDTNSIMLWDNSMSNLKSGMKELDKDFDVNVWVNPQSMYYKSMAKKTYKDTAMITKIDAPNSLDNVDKNTTASDVYNSIRKQLADRVGIDRSLISNPNESEYNAIQIALYYGGKLLKDDQAKLDGSQLLVAKMIIKNSDFYNDAGTKDKPILISIIFDNN